MDPLDIPTARLGQEFSHDQSSMTLIMYGKFEAFTPPPPPTSQATQWHLTVIHAQGVGN